MERRQKWMIPMSVCIVTIIFFSPVYAAHKDIKDSDITLAIESQLMINDAVDAHMIDVKTNEGIVTLSGSVDNLLAKDQAERITESIKGVRAVVNKISVFPVKRSDKEIKKDVTRVLASDPATRAYKIDVTVNDGVVTVSGKVKFWNGKQLIAQVVKGVKGVRDTKNKIGFDYIVGDRTDGEIKAEIERRLSLDPFIYDDLINVKVEEGKVALSGAVGSAEEKTRAYNDAWVTGITSVDITPLEVKWWLRNEMLRESKFALKTDEEIKKAVKDAFLYDIRVMSFNPKVEVENGVVTLSGVVDNLKAKRATEQDARNTIGVERVENYLKVRPVKPLSDREIAQCVRDALMCDPIVERHEIKVNVRNKKAYLNGTVDSYYERQRAEDVASRACGVVDIKNNLTVEYTTTPKSDWGIKNDIEDELFWSAFVDSDDITVSVENGVATLKGTVDSQRELNAAIENAFEGGAERVESQLTVECRVNTTFGYYSRIRAYSPGYFPLPVLPY